MFAVLMVLAALGMLLHGTIAVAKRRALFWIEHHARPG
jgi:ABC-type nitrate/sulfonate/bicarbonate transport system permease component